MDRRAAVQRVAGVSMAHPVGRYRKINAGANGGFPDDPQRLRRVQVPATLLGAENGRVWASIGSNCGHGHT